MSRDAWSGICGNPEPHDPHDGVMLDPILGAYPEHCSGVPAPLLRDIAVEIADYIDTPDFMLDPNSNRDTINFVEGVLRKHGLRGVLQSKETIEGIEEALYWARRRSHYKRDQLSTVENHALVLAAEVERLRGLQ